MQKDLPKEITYHDLLKTFAVTAMMIDHVGFYFFPDQMWWRCIGRLGAPIWFFLAGYGNARTTPAKFWVGGSAIAAGSLAAGMSLFPLNAVFTNIMIRRFIDAVMRVSLDNRWSMIGVGLLMFVLIMPSVWCCEYGTQAMITAMFGYAVRHRATVKGGKSAVAVMAGYGIFSLSTFLLLQWAAFPFSPAQLAFMTVVTVIITAVLYNFSPRLFPRLTASLPRPLVGLIHLMGRRTLEIYVYHLLLFKALGLWFQPKLFKLFDATWFYRQKI